MKGSDFMGMIFSLALFIGGALNILINGLNALNIVIMVISLIAFIYNLPVINKKLTSKFSTKIKTILNFGVCIVAVVLILLSCKILSKENLYNRSQNINKAAVLIQEGEVEKAEAILLKLYEKDSTNGAINLNLAAVQLRKGKLEEAKKYLDAASKTLYHDEMLWFNYGMFYYKNKDYQNALKCYEKAVELNPDFAAARIYSGTMSYQLRDLRRALYHLERAQYLMPDNADILFHLGMSNKDLMNFNEAEEYFKLALKSSPSKDFQNSISNELKEIEALRKGVLN